MRHAKHSLHAATIPFLLRVHARSAHALQPGTMICAMHSVGSHFHNCWLLLLTIVQEAAGVKGMVWVAANPGSKQGTSDEGDKEGDHSGVLTRIAMLLFVSTSRKMHVGHPMRCMRCTHCRHTHKHLKASTAAPDGALCQRRGLWWQGLFHLTRRPGLIVRAFLSVSPPRRTPLDQTVSLLVGIAVTAVVLGILLGVASRFRSAGNNDAAVRSRLATSLGLPSPGTHQENAAFSDETYEPIGNYNSVDAKQSEASDDGMTDYTNHGARPRAHTRVQQGHDLYAVPTEPQNHASGRATARRTAAANPANGDGALQLTKGHTSAQDVYGNDSCYVLAAATPSTSGV